MALEPAGDGDAISIASPLNGQPLSLGDAPPGFVKIDLGTQPFRVPVTATGGDVPRRTLELTQTANAMTVPLTVYQFGQSKQFPDNHGVISFVPDLEGPSGLYVSGVAMVQMPAATGQIAITLSVLETIDMH
jgi:hypothetical protein